MRAAARVALLAAALLLASAGASAAPSCYPSQVGGSGTPARYAQALTDHATPEKMDVLWWWCTDAIGMPSVALLMCRASDRAYCITDAVIAAVGTVGTPRATLDALWASQVKADIWHDVIMRQVADKIAPQVLATRPPLPVYRVPTNGTHPTRPAYTYIAATATTPAAVGPRSGDAPVGATCDMSRYVVNVAGNVYGAFDAARDRVTLCRTQRP